MSNANMSPGMPSILSLFERRDRIRFLKEEKGNKRRIIGMDICSGAEDAISYHDPLYL
jgi:hypothetical protein